MSGKTIHTLRKRFREHRCLIEEGKNKHSVPRHFAEYHAKSTKGLKVWVIESVHGGMSMAERIHQPLCQRETYWIYAQDILSPGRLSEDLEISTIF